MSVEALVISGIVDEGDLKRAFQAGLTRECFEIYDEEFEWIRDRYESRRPFGSRLFKAKFPEFDFLLPNENLLELIEELKREQAYLAVASAIDEIYTGDDPLSQDNAMDKAIALREILGDVVRTHAPNSDVAVKAGWNEGYQHMRKLVAMRANGQSPGIETGIAHFDHHFGGLQPETTYLFLGRPGDAKSFTLAKCVTEGAWGGYRMGVFSPEMTMHQHNCRFHTLLSAKTEIQEALDLDGAFRNRALKDGVGFNIKSYKRFLEYLDEELKGEIHVFTQRYRSERMSLSYIEARIEDYGLDAVIVDPIYKLRAIRRRGNRWEELGEITDALVNLSHAYNIPVVMSNQASRALVGRKGDAPDKDSSFGADSPVQEANCVIGVKHFSDERMMKYNCSKNRDGEPFKFTAKFHPNVGILEDITPIQGDYNAQYDPEKVTELAETMREVEI